MEMTEHVYKQPNRNNSSGLDKNRRSTADRGSALLNSFNTHSIDKEPLFKDISLCDNQSGNGDREMLLKVHSKQSDSFSDEPALSDHDSCITTLPLNDNLFDTVQKKYDVTVSKNNATHAQDLNVFGGNTLNATQSVQNIKSIPFPTESFHLSAHSLVFTDSDSGADDGADRTVSRKKKKNMTSHPMSSLTTSSSHNGLMCNGGPSFSDFKPPPPPYGALRIKQVH